jgi:hypothetical protein
MPTVADCLRQHGETFLQQYSDKISLQQRKLLSAITRCRTGELGSVIFACDGCGRQHWVGRSCGNRHCPSCQQEKTQKWLQKQTDHLLPVQHCLVTFTVPDELRSLLRACPKEGYEAIFEAGSATIQKLLADPKWLGSDNVGFFGVLHTWGRDPTIYHPHVHFVVPAGGVSNDGKKWLATPSTFLFPEAVASPIYRQKFREILRSAGLEKNVDPSVWHKWWEVNVKSVSDGRAVLKYLAPYVFRVAISDNRILECTDESVTYKYTPSKSKKTITRTVPGVKFVRGFLQHALPKGFRKVRYYGWMASNSQTTRDRVKWLVWLFLGWTYWLASGVAPQPDRYVSKRPPCQHCGGMLHLIAITDGSGRVLVSRPLPPLALADHVTNFLDSG